MELEISKLENSIKRCEEKLNNQRFLENASKEVIEKERQKKKDFSDALETLYKQKSYLMDRITRLVSEKYGSEDWVEWLIEEYREECMTSIDTFPKTWFDFVYAPITDNDIINLGKRLKIC